MHHRWANLNARRIPIHQNATNLALQHRNKFRGIAEIVLRSVQRRCQMTMQFLGNGDKISKLTIVDKQSGWPKSLFLKFTLCEKLIQHHTEDAHTSCRRI